MGKQKWTRTDNKTWCCDWVSTGRCGGLQQAGFIWAGDKGPWRMTCGHLWLFGLKCKHMVPKDQKSVCYRSYTCIHQHTAAIRMTGERMRGRLITPMDLYLFIKTLNSGVPWWMFQWCWTNSSIWMGELIMTFFNSPKITLDATNKIFFKKTFVNNLEQKKVQDGKRDAPSLLLTFLRLEKKNLWSREERYFSKKGRRTMLLWVLTHITSWEGNILPAIKKRRGTQTWKSLRQWAWRGRSQWHILFNQTCSRLVQVFMDFS